MSVTLNTTLGPIAVKEMYEGYTAGIDITRGPYIEKTYLASSWPAAFPCANALMGGGVPPTGRHVCPESPNLRCMNAVIAPKAEFDARDGGRPQFNLPLIKATYQVPTWEEMVADDPTGAQSFPNEIDPGQPYTYMECSIDFDTEVIKLPGRTYGFADGTPVDVPVARTVAVAQFTLVRRWQSTLPYANVTAFLNRLNNAVFLGQPKGQIKLRKCSTRRQYTTDGSKAQEVALTFQWREADHNMVLRPDTGAFALIYVGGNTANALPYFYADLTQVLR